MPGQEEGRVVAEGRSWQEGKPVCSAAAQLCSPSMRKHAGGCQPRDFLLSALHRGCLGEKGQEEKENAALKRVSPR